MRRILPSFYRHAGKEPTIPPPRAAAKPKRAGAHLKCCGLRVVARNFRIRGGEIDLICRDGKTLVFVEVRLRSRSDFGGAGASITPTKRRRIILAAQHYLAGKPECDCRFDCVLIEGERLEWIKNAFSADD
jgi:putative endonuclease